MKLKRQLLTAVLLTCGFVHLGRANSDPNPTLLGAEKTPTPFMHIEIKNLQDERLGRITDLGVDLINGRIVEVLVESDASLDVGNKIVAVPPGALKWDPDNLTLRLDASRDLFRTAAAIDLSKWVDYGRSDRVAAAYHLFGRETYFIENGTTSSTPEGRPKVSLGYVERSHKLQDMPVGNYQGVEFGKLWSMTFNIPRGLILSAIVLSPGNLETKSVIPARAFSFNEARDALLLDDTKEEFAEEPRYVFTETAYGNEATSHEEAYTGPRTSGALEQGDSYMDTDRTLFIYQNIRLAKIYQRHMQIGTMNGRVTLRGWVRSADDKRHIGEIAIGASELELVDNQLTVGRPSASQ